ncbi:hypothetical protein KEM48_011413 [Puccinia striiformis f. sp. tritici PST-130]|nr:hypothetical protein KEM48_011413 [Puccinia striiformis f. sp. tritici PST-130]
MVLLGWKAFEQAVLNQDPPGRGAGIDCTSQRQATTYSIITHLLTAGDSVAFLISSTGDSATWLRFNFRTTDIVHHISPLPLRFGRPIDMRKPKPASRKPPDTLIQRLRRAQNATLNRVAFARLRSTQPVPEAPQPEPYPSDSVDDVEMSNNPYNPDLANQSDVEASSDEEQGDQVRWVNLAQPTDDDQPQRIDPAIESHQEQYRLLMKEYNWT